MFILQSYAFSRVFLCLKQERILIQERFWSLQKSFLNRDSTVMILQYISNTGIQYFVRVLQHMLKIATKHLFYPQIQLASSQHWLGMVFAKITTTIAIVLLMEGTAVDPVSIENSAQNANAKLETLTKSQMQEQETASAMIRPMLTSATLMAGTAVELVSIPSTVLNVSALGKTLVL